MKKIIQLLVCILHPLAVVLAWVNLAQRDDLRFLTKLVWAVLMVIPAVPFLYVLFSGELW